MQRVMAGNSNIINFLSTHNFSEANSSEPILEHYTDWLHIFDFFPLGNKLGRLRKISMETFQEYFHIHFWFYWMYHGYLRCSA